MEPTLDLIVASESLLQGAGGLLQGAGLGGQGEGAESGEEEEGSHLGGAGQGLSGQRGGDSGFVEALSVLCDIGSTLESRKSVFSIDMMKTESFVSKLLHK